MRHEIKVMGMIEGIRSYKDAFIASKHIDSNTPFTSLHVVRKFDELYPEAAGYYFDFRKMHKVLPLIPPSIVVITDPSVASDLMVQSEFSDLSADTVTHRAFRPSRGEFILSRNDEKKWREEKVAANRVYSPREVEYERIKTVAESSVDSLLLLVQNERLPEDWSKFLVCEQVTHHLTG